MIQEPQVKRTRTPKSTRKVIINLNSMDDEGLKEFSNMLAGEGPGEVLKKNESMSGNNNDNVNSYEPAHYRYANNDQSLVEFEIFNAQSRVSGRSNSQQTLQPPTPHNNPFDQSSHHQQLELQQKLDLAMKQSQQEKEDINQQFAKIQQQKDKEIEKQKLQIEEMKNSLMQHEGIRKVQQQQLIQLKGNMRVYCRVKPLMEGRDSSLRFP